MEHTEYYHLPQWEETDRIQMDDFNDAFAAIDAALAAAPKIATGTYVGDDAASRTIPLGFTPKMVFLCPQGRATAEGSGSSWHAYGGIATVQTPVYQDPKITSVQTTFETAVAMEITDHGFIVHTNYTPVTFSNHSFYAYANNNGLRYSYFAIG